MLLVVDSLDGGGAERHVVDLAVALRGRGHAVVVACSAPGVLAERLGDAAIAVAQCGGRAAKRRFSLRYAAWLRWLVSRGGFDVVHAHIYASESAAAAAVVGTDVPLVVTDHTEGPWRGSVARAISGLVYRRADCLIGVSSAIDRMLRADFHVPAQRVETILPVPLALASMPAGSARARLQRVPFVGRVGRLQPEKGVDVFLHAARLVLARAPHVRFVVVGDGPLRDELAALSRRLDIADRVDFLGYRPDARALIAQLDVAVVSSRTDGSPLVVMEAMEAAVPIVATAVGGVPDQLRHGREGLIVAPDDASSLAAAVVTLVRDPAAARRMGDAGRRRAAALPHAAMVDAVERAYAQAMLRRRAAGTRREPGGAVAPEPVLQPRVL